MNLRILLGSISATALHYIGAASLGLDAWSMCYGGSTVLLLLVLVLL